MSRARRPGLGAVLALAALGGCASSPDAAPRAEVEGPAQGGREDETAPDSPWGRVAGGPAGAPAPAPAVVRFREPTDPRPVAEERRPALGAELVLGVVAVRDGRLEPEAALLLRLEAELSRVDELAAVVGPGAAADPPEVDLAGLAALAAAGERDLLLVEVRPPRRPGSICDGYLVHAATGALLACWSVDAQGLVGGVPPSGGAAQDLVARIAAAHGRLRGE